MSGRDGFLMLNGWDGFSSTRVLIVGETPKRLRIQAIERTKLAGRSRWLTPGETALVPKYAVRDATPTAMDAPTTENYNG